MQRAGFEGEFVLLCSPAAVSAGWKHPFEFLILLVQVSWGLSGSSVHTGYTICDTLAQQGSLVDFP